MYEGAWQHSPSYSPPFNPLLPKRFLANSPNVADLEAGGAALKCRSCGKGRYAPPVHIIKGVFKDAR
jgi:hypothetical protein